MDKPRVIVCEQSGVWATALARHLPCGVRLAQTRGLAECVGLLTGSPGSLVAVELTARNLAGVLELVGGLSSRFPLARAIVLADYGLSDGSLADGGLADGGLAECEWLFREAGAIHFTSSPRELAGLERTIANHLARLPATSSGFVDRVWDALPWSDSAVA